MKIVVVREKLSDGSFVFNVHVPQCVIPAVSEKSAQCFADDLAALCNENNAHDDDMEVSFSY